LTEIYILLAEEVAPSIINRPIVPTAVAVAAPPTIDPDAIHEEARMKEAAMKADEARTEADKARSEAWVKTAAKAGAEAPEARRESRRRSHRHES
jgi:hypothetical protein